MLLTITLFTTLYISRSKNEWPPNHPEVCSTGVPGIVPDKSPDWGIEGDNAHTSDNNTPPQSDKPLDSVVPDESCHPRSVSQIGCARGTTRSDPQPDHPPAQLCYFESEDSHQPHQEATAAARHTRRAYAAIHAPAKRQTAHSTARELYLCDQVSRRRPFVPQRTRIHRRRRWTLERPVGLYQTRRGHSTELPWTADAFRDCPVLAQTGDMYWCSSRNGGCGTLTARGREGYPARQEGPHYRSLGHRCARPSANHAQRLRRRQVCPRSCRLRRSNKSSPRVRGSRALGDRPSSCRSGRQHCRRIGDTVLPANPASSGPHRIQHARLPERASWIWIVWDRSLGPLGARRPWSYSGF